LELTIKEFAERIVRLTNSGSSISYHPLPVDDPKQRRPDITRARNILGWEPKVDLEDGLRQTIEFFRSRI
jgi:dTDP-glucose 4,6-dehydratase